MRRREALREEHTPHLQALSQHCTRVLTVSSLQPAGGLDSSFADKELSPRAVDSLPTARVAEPRFKSCLPAPGPVPPQKQRKEGNTVRKVVTEGMGCVGPRWPEARDRPGAQGREAMFPRLTKPGRAWGRSRVSPRKGQRHQKRV